MTRAPILLGWLALADDSLVGSVRIAPPVAGKRDEPDAKEH
jgi:hypothetical protein